MTADGYSTRSWDRVGTTTLTADWSPKNYQIRVVDNGTVILWVSGEGLSDSECTIQFDTLLDVINLIYIFKHSPYGYKDGKIFDHFECDDSTFGWSSVPDLGPTGTVIDITPIWICEKHTVYFDSQGGSYCNSITACGCDTITLPTPTRIGYTFDGWYTKADGGEKVNWTRIPDLTPGDQNNGSIQLFAHWTKIKYKVYYYSNGGTGTMTSMSYTCGDELTLSANKFTKTGHDFTGWSKSPSGSVEYTDKQSFDDLLPSAHTNIYLYAIWKAKEYSITYKNLSREFRVDGPYYYIYGEGLNSMPRPYYDLNTEDDRVRFYGWYTSLDFTTQVTSIPKTSIGDVTVYAKYDFFVYGINDSKTYTITDAGIDKNPYFAEGVSLDIHFYNSFKDTTLKKIKIEFSLDLWEVDDGYQDIYLKNYHTNETIWSATINHAGNKVGGKKTYTYEFTLDIEKYKKCNTFTFRFDAHGAWSDTWKFENFNATVYFVN